MRTHKCYWPCGAEHSTNISARGRLYRPPTSHTRCLYRPPPCQSVRAYKCYWPCGAEHSTNKSARGRLCQLPRSHTRCLYRPPTTRWRLYRLPTETQERTNAISPVGPNIVQTSARMRLYRLPSSHNNKHHQASQATACQSVRTYKCYWLCRAEHSTNNSARRRLCRLPRARTQASLPTAYCSGASLPTACQSARKYRCYWP